MSDPTDIVERLAGMSADHGPDGWPAVQMRDISALCDEVRRLRAELAEAQKLARDDFDLRAEQRDERNRLRAALAAWEDTLTAVMPDDFKDWHQNSHAEWPAVAAGVITALRADRDEGWRLAAQVPQPATLAVPAGMALVPKGLLQEARDNAQASCAESGVSVMRLEYRAELVQRLDAVLAATPQAPQAAPADTQAPAAQPAQQGGE